MIRPRKTAHWQQGFSLEAVYKRGRRYQTAELREQSFPRPTQTHANLRLSLPSLEQLRLKAPEGAFQARVIEVIPSQIVTRSLLLDMPALGGEVPARVDQDILKIGVFERHRHTGRYTLAWVRGFGIKAGAIATSINHDSHNVIVVGSSDELILGALQDLKDIDGGICVRSADGRRERLALPIAGLMTDASPQDVAHALRALKDLARDIGCCLEEPFLQLSFLALPVIPHLKITDSGLIDVEQFKKVPVFEPTGGKP